jgi:hypothetical protein
MMGTCNRGCTYSVFEDQITSTPYFVYIPVVGLLV